MAEKLTEPRTVDSGRVVVTDLIESGSNSARFAGHIEVDPQQRRLITLGGTQLVSTMELRKQLAMEVEGISALEFVGPVDRLDDYWRGICIVEVEPRGRPAAELAPLAERDAVALGLAIAEVVERAHARGVLVRGIRPELVYVDAGIGGAGRLAGLVPRAALLLDTTRPASHGMQILADLYRGPEDPFNFAPVPRTDVFALCATLFALVAGRHPFGDYPHEQMGNLMADRVGPYPGSPALGAVLSAGLARDPAKRPDLADLVSRLQGR
jgi:serine/threonine protein kinase